MIKVILLAPFLVLFLSQVCLADDSKNILRTALELKLGESQEWLNLLHYKKNIWGQFKSEADSKNFFISKKGKESPVDELKSSLIAISSPTKEHPDEHAQCRFPARTLFFKKHLPKFTKSFDMYCPLYEKFIKKLSAKSVSIVFSSYYLNNPSSAFGHTLMRFSKEEEMETDDSFELLDYATNYAAVPTTNNAIIYTVMGLTGGFNGEFATLPYFYKVREYNDFESRDLWDYKLNLSREEVEALVAHVFEMRQTFFDYFYFTENCSYHMLGMLDAINPHWNLTEKNPSIVVPVDTLQILAETKGLIKKVTFRPSKMRIVKKRLNNLNAREIENFDKVVKAMDPKALKHELPAEEKANILDAVIDFIDFKYSEEILITNSDATEVKRKFLIARSKVNHKSKRLEVPFPTREQPQIGHRSRRIGVGYGRDQYHNDLIRFEYRATLHDLLDSTVGHNENSLMEMGHIKLSYYPEHKRRNNTKLLQIDYASLFHVISLSPIEKYFSTVSWKAQFGYRKLNDQQCPDCSSPFLEIGGGLSYRFMNILFYSMMKTEVEVSSDFKRRGYRLGLGPESAFVIRLGDNFSSVISGEYLLKHAYETEWVYKYSAKFRIKYSSNQSIELDYSKYETHWKLLSKYYFYF